MPYIGRNHIAGDHTSNFKILDDISSYTATFDGSSTNAVSTSNETIRIPLHRFLQGQRVTYSNGGGGNIGGLTNGTAYFITIDTHNTIKLATSLVNANNNTNINLTSVGTGSAHTLTAAFDGVNTEFKATHNGGTSAHIANTTQLQIAINNVVQKPNNDSSYTEGFRVVDGRKIQFKTAPTSSDVFWGNIIANTIETFDISDLKIDNFTGDGSTTQYTLSREVPNNQSIMVTLDGVTQHPSDNSNTRAYSLVTDSIIQFTSPPGNGIEIQVRHLGFAGAATGEVSGFYGRTGNVSLTSSDNITVGDIPTVRNINASGIVTASSFSGGFSGNIVGTSATFTGNLSVGGVLTYEDVTNIDSVGIITAAKDIHVGAGVSAVGVITGRYLNPSSVSTQNLIIGWESSARNVTGSWNVLLGRRAGEGLTSGGSAVCIGANAGQLLGSSSGIFIGGQAGSKVTGGGNVFIGMNAGQQTTSAGACTIIGTYAGIDNQGSNNTLVGNYAGRGTSGNTDGAQNTFIGTGSGFKIRGGDDNTGVGYYSLVELLGGNKNVAIGRNAGDALVSGNNNIIIGYNADASTSSISNEITLGDANINHLRIPGIGCSISEGGAVISGIVTATSFSGDGSALTGISAGGSSIARLSQKLSSSVAGAGSFETGAFRVRQLNSEDYDPDGIVSLVSAGGGTYGFQLQAGTYRIKAKACGYGVGTHQVVIYSETDSSNLANSEGTPGGGDENANLNSWSELDVRFTISSAKTYTLRHRCSSTRYTVGLGRGKSHDASSDFGLDKRYAIVDIEKIS